MLFSCFWSYKSLKIDQATRLFLGGENPSGKENGVSNLVIQAAKYIVEGEDCGLKLSVQGDSILTSQMASV